MLVYMNQNQTRSKGFSYIEFLIFLIVMLPMVFVVVDFVRCFYFSQKVSLIAREAANGVMKRCLYAGMNFQTCMDAMSTDLQNFATATISDFNSSKGRLLVKIYEQQAGPPPTQTSITASIGSAAASSRFTVNDADLQAFLTNTTRTVVAEAFYTPSALFLGSMYSYYSTRTLYGSAVF